MQINAKIYLFLPKYPEYSAYLPVKMKFFVEKAVKHLLKR